MNFRMKISALSIPILAIAFASCSKEELNEKTNDVRLKSESGVEQHVVQDSWDLNCDDENGSTVVVDVTEQTSFPIAGCDYTLYFRPQGSTSPYSVFASNTSSTFPLFFEFTGVWLDEGCYEFVVQWSYQGPFLDPSNTNVNIENTLFNSCCVPGKPKSPENPVTGF